MNLIQDTIKSFIKDYNLEDSKYIYLVAFSGGFDSMCLLHALRQTGSNKIIAIHLNHNWRGDESDKEEQNCKDFCMSLGVDFYSEKLSEDIEKNETVAREERYKFFEKCAKKFNSKIIFTAHNKNDNAETLIYRMTKGTGVTGLQGIAPARGIYFRPLLNIERCDIEKYCIQNGLNPNSDSSNDDLIHNRNLIRKNVLPELLKINPSVISSLNKLSQSAVEDTQIIKEYLEIVKKEIYKSGKYNTSKFLKLSRPLQLRILYEYINPLVPQNYDRERIITLYNFILENKTSKSGKICSVTTGYDLFVSEKHFEVISSKEQNTAIVQVNDCGKYKFQNKNMIISKCDLLPKNFESKSKNVIYVDLSGVDFPLEIRTRRDGDEIQPFGMSGHQKLKKYFNSRKIPNHVKDELILITKGKEVLWVCGIGISERIKVITKPTHKIEIED
jgi:tRNA(Ile)-lysidine synthase